MNISFKKKGFTLIELLLVAAVIGILQIIVIYTYINAQKQSRDVRRKSDVNKISTALEMYHTEKKEYPATDLWVSSQSNGANDILANTLLKNRYIDSIPCDPKVSEWNCSHGGHNQSSNPDFGYVYILKNYNFSGSYNSQMPGKNKYGLYASLESPSNDDKKIVNSFDAYEKAFKEYMKNSLHFDISYKIGN